MKDFEWRIVWTLWWALTLLYVPEPDRDRLVAAVHRDDVDVHVDQQVGLGGALGELDGLAVAGLAEVDDLVGSSASWL